MAKCGKNGSVQVVSPSPVDKDIQRTDNARVHWQTFKAIWQSIPLIIRIPVALAAGIVTLSKGVAEMRKVYSWLRWLVWDQKVIEYMNKALSQARSEGKRTEGVLFQQSGIAAGMKRDEVSIVRSLKRLQTRGEVCKVLPPDIWQLNT